MHSKNRYAETEIVKFSFNIFLALVLVTILSIVTSSGWMTVLFFMFCVPLLTFISLGLILIAFSIENFTRKSLVWVDKYLAYTMIYIQAFVTIFNIGDCAGSSSIKIGNFIQRVIQMILLRPAACSSYSNSVNPWIRDEIIIGLYALNLLILGIFIMKTLVSSHSKSA